MKHNTSFRCFLPRTTVDCCGYTLSILLSRSIILFQAKEFKRAFLFKVPLSNSNTLQICAQPAATTCSCYCYSSCFLYNHYYVLTPLPPLKKKQETKTKTKTKKAKRYLYTNGHTDRKTLTPCSSFRSWGLQLALYHQST